MTTAATIEFTAPAWDGLRTAIDGLGQAPLTEDAVRAHLRPLFSRSLASGGTHLAAHVFGRPLDRTADDVAGALREWYDHAEGAREAWDASLQEFRAGVARLVGAPRVEGRPEGCPVVPKTNPGQGLRAVLNAMPVRRPNVVATRGESDSIDVILKTYQMRDRASVSWVEPDDSGRFHAPDIARRISYASDVVMVSHVFWRTGQALEGIERIVRAAHDSHAVVVLDLSRSAGVLPLDLEALDVDYAIGDSVGAFRAGTGACWLMVHPRHTTGERARRTLDTGRLAMRPRASDERPSVPEFAQGGDGWLECTPPFLPPYQARAGLGFLLGVGVGRLRDYALEQLAYLKQSLESNGETAHQHDPGAGLLLVPDGNAASLSRRLRTDHRIATDACSGFLRLCPDVLTTRREMATCAQRIAESRTR